MSNFIRRITRGFFGLGERHKRHNPCNSERLAKNSDYAQNPALRLRSRFPYSPTRLLSHSSLRSPRFSHADLGPVPHPSGPHLPNSPRIASPELRSSLPQDRGDL
jgi:hypothetical protein